MKQKKDDVYMKTKSFIQFIRLIDSTRKSINKLKLENANLLGIKGVHILWVYELLQHPEGLSAAALAANSMIDRSLVSREIEQLTTNGFIVCDNPSGYNAKFRLTESGMKMAEYVKEEAMRLQLCADEGITEEELEAFYKTFEKLNRNLRNISNEYSKNNKK